MSAPIDIQAVRARLEQQGGPQVWRSLEAVAETTEFKDYLHREFPTNASEWLDPVGRRSFLKLMSASMALAGVTACTVQPTEMIVPYVRQPEEEIPGKPLFFATAMPHTGGVARVRDVNGTSRRPTKVEGNGLHPASLGGSSARVQASVLDLYDPDLGEPWRAGIAMLDIPTDVARWNTEARADAERRTAVPRFEFAGDEALNQAPVFQQLREVMPHRPATSPR